MSIQIGLQLYSVRDELAKNMSGTLERVAEIGYTHVEIAARSAEEGITAAGVGGRELSRGLERCGLKAVSVHVEPLEKAEAEAVAEFCRETGAGAVVCPIHSFRNKSSAVEFADSLNRYGEKLKKHDLQLYFHNHFNEFQTFEGESVMELLLANTEEELVKFELDTYWALRGGVDPIEFLSKLGDRCDMIHQKDLPASVQTVNLFDVYGSDAELTIERMFSKVGAGDFAEIGRGVMDIGAIIAAANEAGHVKYMFVEQDATLGNQLDSVAISYANVTKLL